MAFYGIASNLVNYLTTQLHEDTVSSVRNVNNWSGSVWLTPILGAYIADSFLGRFWTFTFSSLIYVMVNPPSSRVHRDVHGAGRKPSPFLPLISIFIPIKFFIYFCENFPREIFSDRSRVRGQGFRQGMGQGRG